MKKKIILFIGVVLVLSMMFIGCGSKEKVEDNPEGVKNTAEGVSNSNWEEENKVVIVAPTWYPFIGKEDGEKGSTIEIAEKAFEKFGVEVEFKNMNWDRAISEVANGYANAMVADIWEVVNPFMKTELSDEIVQAYINEKNYEELFRNHVDKIIGSEAIGSSDVSFIVKKGNEFEYNSIEDIKDMKFGALANYDYAYGVTEYINQGGPNIIIAEDEVNLIRMLESNRIEVMAENIDVFINRIKEIGLNSEDFSEIKIPDSTGVMYLCFSPVLESSKKYIEMLDEGIRKLRESGELQEILDKYDLGDWNDITYEGHDSYYDFFIDEYFWYLEQSMNETSGEED